MENGITGSNNSKTTIKDGKIQSAYYDKSAFEDIDPCFKKKYKNDISEYLNSLIGLEITFTKREDKKNG